MSVQVKTKTPHQAIPSRSKVRMLVGLIVGLSALTALFEAISPQSFDRLDPFVFENFIVDAFKDLGIIVGFALALAYLGQQGATIARAMSPRSRTQLSSAILFKTAPWASILEDTVRIIAFSLVITLFARVSIHFGSNPVPITGQTLAILVTGAALGCRRGTLATLLYLAQGSAGLHVFAGGNFGLFWGLASGGYLVGFVAAAFIVGFLVDQGWDRGPRLLLAMLAGNITLYVPGLIQLALFVGWDKTLAYGLYPFIPGDLAKLYIASLVATTAWSTIRIRGKELPLWR